MNRLVPAVSMLTTMLAIAAPACAGMAENGLGMNGWGINELHVNGLRAGGLEENRAERSPGQPGRMPRAFDAGALRLTGISVK